LYTRPSITQLPVAPCAGCFIQRIKTKYEPNHQQTELPPHSALPIRGEKKKHLPSSHQNTSTSYTLHEAYTNHWTKLTRAETKRKKEFNLEVWEKETSNTIS